MNTQLGSLLSNPRNKLVRYVPFAKCFMFTVELDKATGKRKKERKLCGITKIMGKYFWPDYVYTRDRYNMGTGAHSKEDGINRGKQVHKQLRDYANLSEKAFKKKYSDGVHKYTLYAIKTLKMWKLKPVCAEFVIYDEENGIATAVDMICTPSNSKGGEVVLLDWKCGFDYYMVKSNNVYMKGPLEGYSCCPLYQGYYQLAIEYAILTKKYGITPVKCIVVQLSQEQINPY